jgi:hypothetical protein
VIVPSESLFTPIQNILNVLNEYSGIQNSEDRISYEIVYVLQNKASELISKNAAPIIKSRSASISSYSTELYKSLLSKLNNHKEDFNTLFQEASSYIQIAEEILKKGYEYYIHYFMIL